MEIWENLEIIHLITKYIVLLCIKMSFMDIKPVKGRLDQDNLTKLELNLYHN